MVTRHRMLTVALGLALVAAGCSDDGGTGDGDESAADADLEVRTVEETYVDESRETPRSGDVPAEPSRTLETVVFLPEGDGPYPLLVFSHGLSSAADNYLDLLGEVASAGFLIVAPEFPLTSENAPTAPDVGDTQNQPGDVSFLIDTVLAEAETGEEPYGDLVDPEHIGAFGHSNGAVTTYGVAANTCCRDDRIDAAVILAGLPEPYGGGDYAFDEAPPMVLVHGTSDHGVPHEDAVRTFNELTGVKGLLSLPRVGHTEFLYSSGTGFDATISVIRDFFRSQLGDDEAAADRLATEEVPEEGMELHFATGDSADVTLPTTPG
jgi:dienelactone hydrolase